SPHRPFGHLLSLGRKGRSAPSSGGIADAAGSSGRPLPEGEGRGEGGRAVAFCEQSRSFPRGATGFGTYLLAHNPLASLGTLDRSHVRRCSSRSSPFSHQDGKHRGKSHSRPTQSPSSPSEPRRGRGAGES